MNNVKRICKKCKCELSDYSKGNLCDNCRKKKSERLKNVVVGAASLFGSAFLLVGLILRRKR